MNILFRKTIECLGGEGDDMRIPKTIRGILTRMVGKNQDVEMSEELTNAYFGNQEAWQITPTDKNSQTEINKEP